jgi:enoyl-CoA hydratase/carnithine racemase
MSESERPEPKVLFALGSGVAVLTLNRPEHRNAIDIETVSELTDLLGRCRDDDAIRVVILTGAGSCFCAGGDVGRIGDELTSASAKDFVFRHVYGVSRAIALIDKPVLAALNGPALGAGLDISLLCDLRFMADSAFLQEAYVKVGVPPGDGGGWLLPRVIGTSRALDLLWTGRRVAADEALRLGLVDRTFPGDQLMAETLAYADALARGPQMAIRMTKRMVVQGKDMSLTGHMDQVSSHMALIRETADFAEGLAAFKGRREPRFG